MTPRGSVKVKTNAMLSKINIFAKETALCNNATWNYATFYSHLSYVCAEWGQGINQNHQTSILQIKVAWTASLKNFNVQ